LFDNPFDCLVTVFVGQPGIVDKRIEIAFGFEAPARILVDEDITAFSEIGGIIGSRSGTIKILPLAGSFLCIRFPPRGLPLVR
jgi:hypothetical protein